MGLSLSNFYAQCVNTVSFYAIAAAAPNPVLDHYGRWFAKSVRVRMEQHERKPLTSRAAIKGSATG